MGVKSTPVCPIDTGRYGSPEMKAIFEEERRLENILKVEAAVAYAHATVGNIPKAAGEEIAKKATTKYVTVQRRNEIDRMIGHDLMAAVRALTEVCEGEGKKWVHFGLTSNDVEDTATALQFKEALEIIEKDLIQLENVLKELARKHRDLVMVGRTHGQHIGVITLGLKFAVWLREIARHIQRLGELRKRVLVGKIMGAVGTGAGLGEKSIEVQEIALKRLGLQPADMVTQIIQRDIHSELVSFLANVACSLDKFGTEIRNLQRTEIQELMEPFEAERQVGSSAMPAKRNPVTCERVCSLAKLMRSLTITSYENIVLWHERDLTNSANERFLFSLAFILLDEMLKKMIIVLSGVVVFPQNMKRNLELTGGLILSERVTGKLVEKGMGRQEAHELVRKCSMKALATGISFKDSLICTDEVSKRLSESEIDYCLDYSTYLGVAGKLVDNAVKMTEREQSSHDA
jgi:adenylosuccinate lyase